MRISDWSSDVCSSDLTCWCSPAKPTSASVISPAGRAPTRVSESPWTVWSAGPRKPATAGERAAGSAGPCALAELGICRRHRAQRDTGDLARHSSGGPAPRSARDLDRVGPTVDGDVCAHDQGGGVREQDSVQRRALIAAPGPTTGGAAESGEPA